MKVLFVGDVVASGGCDYLSKKLPALRRQLGADITIINGENSADQNGISQDSARALFSCGADVITTGNHAFKQKNSMNIFDDDPNVIRPANFHRTACGKGFCEIDMGRYRVAVVNLIGRAYMEPVDSPFDCIDELLKKIDTKNIIVDFHAEATSEKRVMGFYLDGRVSAVVGTHTHVATADAQILKNGTAYITDVGMVGSRYSVLGAAVECATRKLVTSLPTRLDTAEAVDMEINAVLIEIDEKTGKAVSIQSITA